MNHFLFVTQVTLQLLGFFISSHFQMQWKPYISIFFTLVFLGKFLSVDSALPQLFFDAEDIVFVNPFCEKRNAQSSDETYSETTSNTIVTVGEVCTSVFQFEFSHWEKTVFSANFQKPKHKTPSLISVYGDKFYPPPRV